MIESASKPSSSNDQEIIFYTDVDGVKITNTRAIFNGKTYAMTNISSICVEEIPPNHSPAFVIGIIGIVVAIINLIIGLVIVFIAICFFFLGKSKYSVHITSSSGETDAISSTNKKYIQDIVSAMNEAIVHRG